MDSEPVPNQNERVELAFSSLEAAVADCFPKYCARTLKGNDDAKTLFLLRLEHSRNAKLSQSDPDDETLKNHRQDILRAYYETCQRIQASGEVPDEVSRMMNDPIDKILGDFTRHLTGFEDSSDVEILSEVSAQFY